MRSSLPIVTMATIYRNAILEGKQVEVVPQAGESHHIVGWLRMLHGAW